VDHRSDIYALGCMMYEMACGRPPFASPSVRELIAGHLRGTPEPPRSHRRDIPADLAAIILKALAKTPAARQKSMSEFADDLERCAASLPAASRSGDRLGAIDGSNAASIYPVSKPARDARTTADSRSTRSRRASRAWIVLAAGTITLSALAAFFVERRSGALRTEPMSPTSIAPVTAPATAAAPPIVPPVVSSPAAPPAAVPAPPPEGLVAPPASAARLPATKPRPPVRPASVDGGRASPATASSSQPDPSRPSLGGEEVENPWPN
jgi:serine/threonine-protein kinase